MKMVEENNLNPDSRPCPPERPVRPERPAYYDEVEEQFRIAAGREERDLLLYQFLIDQAMAQATMQQQRVITNQNVLRTNREVTRRNLELLNETYRNMTGQRLISVTEEFTTPINYRSGLETATFNELRDAEIYRDLCLQVPMGMLHNVLMRLYTNTMFNIDRLNFLYSRATV